MKIDVAIIGGTGVGDVLAQMKGSSLHVPTPEGQLAGKVISHEGGDILLVSRHSAGHKVPPHRVNYKAIALGLKKLGVRYCFSTAAVGSLRRDWLTGTLVACSDFLDLTGRHQTMFDSNVVHTDFTWPFSPSGRAAILSAAATMGLDVKPEGTYICENGPRYETPHEITLLTHVGDVVGMTASTEAILLHEAGIEYTCLALVTNLAAGIEDMPLSHEEVVEEMQKNASVVVKLLLAAIDLVRK
ncbi:MAG TPA: MTAP family purine nucleoside phosphorylase [Fimbriimonadaceae bacterium]|jgi:5'-methylthioadenosine phosphorylase